MVARVRRIVADSAGPGERTGNRIAGIAIQPADVIDGERARAEQLLAARDRAPHALSGRGNIGVLADRSVIGTEDGIASTRLLESLTAPGRRDRPRLIRLVTGVTAPPVRSNALEKRVIHVERRGRRDGALDAGSVAERQLIRGVRRGR
jgi:hypothetical protein